MPIEKLAIEGAWIAHSPILTDDRGFFREWFRAIDIEKATGRAFEVRQANISVSQRGVLRGIHYSLAANGQGKWITCVSGSIWDVVVDIRPSSPTYKRWIGIPLSGNMGTSIFISEGLGHGFVSLEDNSIVSYLLTTPYSPNEEYEINPLDLELNIAWPLDSPQLSAKDAHAKTLSEMLTAGDLPL